MCREAGSELWETELEARVGREPTSPNTDFREGLNTVGGGGISTQGDG